MSLKEGKLSKAEKEFEKTIEDVRNGKKVSAEKLARYISGASMPAEIYEELIAKYEAIQNEKSHKKLQISKKKKTIRIILCVILLSSLVAGAVIYHFNAIEKAYADGNSWGQHIGYKQGQKAGYDKGYAYYEKIKDEYEFYHEYAVRVTTTGKKYHRYDCYHAKDKSFYIYNISTAEAKGYTPCLDCYD
jgi:hypothetical protein